MSSNQKQDLSAEWRAKRNELLTELADGEADVNVRAGSVTTRKYYVKNQFGQTDDVFVRVEYSAAVTLKCPQTDDGIAQAKTIASELAMKHHVQCMEELEVNVMAYLKGEGVDVDDA